jgi:hypothetical protein
LHLLFIYRSCENISKRFIFSFPYALCRSPGDLIGQLLFVLTRPNSRLDPSSMPMYAVITGSILYLGILLHLRRKKA